MRPYQLYFLLFSLYWAQGLPVGFMTHALPVILRDQGLSLKYIGSTGLLMLPWAIKVLWAPWVDVSKHGRWGHYRAWILCTQIAMIILLIVLAFVPIPHTQDQYIFLYLLFLSLFVMNFFGATQDIATDGLAVKLLNQQQQGWGNTLQVIGSRLGFIIGGGAVLGLMDWLSWKTTFLALALLVSFNTLPILFFNEPIAPKQGIEKSSDTSLLKTVKAYLSYFFSNHELKYWLFVLLSAKVADGLFGTVQKTIMVDLGLPLRHIGLYVTTIGAICALVGALLAGGWLKRISKPMALILFTCLKTFTLLGFFFLAWKLQNAQYVSNFIVYTINAFEELTSAMLLVVMLTLIMQYCRKATGATDFTFQVSIMAMVSGGLYVFGGFVADLLGYLNDIGLVIMCSFIHILIIFLWYRTLDKSQIKI